MTCSKSTSGNAIKIEENIIAVMGQVLEDRQRPGSVFTAITDENGFFDTYPRLMVTRAAKAEGEEASVADDPVRCRAAATFQKRRFTC
jgi:hypothetical protein